MREEGGETGGDSLVAVQRTMAVLEMLADADSGLLLGEIAKALEVNANLAQRITDTLESLGYIIRGKQGGRYYAGYRISNVGLRLMGHTRLLDQCQPVLRRLAEQTGELVLLSVADREAPRWVMAVTGVRRRLQVEPMTSLEVHSTATGKAWLATLPEAEATRVLKGTMRALTPQTITSLPKMRAELKNIRATGISFSNQENEVGIGSVATAIHPGQAGTPVGFVSITAPMVRASDVDFDRYRALVLEAARELAAGWPVPDTSEFSDGALIGPGVQVL